MTLLQKLSGAVFMLWLAGCLSGSELTRYERLCKRTGGMFINCEVAFASACADEIIIEGKPVVCSCPTGKTWQDRKGCR